MSSTLLCASGEATSIWEVNSNLVSVHEFEISSIQSRVVDWNQNSLGWMLVCIVDNYIFVCSSQGDMYLKNINKVTLISSTNSVGGEEPSRECDIFCI